MRQAQLRCSRRARILVGLALFGSLTTVMVPCFGPMGEKATQRASVSITLPAPDVPVPAMPAASVGDQYHDWSRMAYLVDAGVRLIGTRQSPTH